MDNVSIDVVMFAHMRGKHYHKMDYGTEYTYWIPGRCESWRLYTRRCADSSRENAPTYAGMTTKDVLSRCDQGLLRNDDKANMSQQPRTTSNRGKAPFTLEYQPLTGFQTSNLEHIKEKASKRRPAGLDMPSGFPVGAGMTLKDAPSRRDQGLLRNDGKGSRIPRSGKRRFTLRRRKLKNEQNEQGQGPICT